MKVLHVSAVLCGLVVLLVTRVDGRFGVESEDELEMADDMEEDIEQDPVRKWYKDSDVMDDDDETDEHFADPNPLRIRIRNRFPGRFPFGGMRLPFFDAEHSNVDNTQDIQEMLMQLLLDAKRLGRQRCPGGKCGGGKAGKKYQTEDLMQLLDAQFRGGIPICRRGICMPRLGLVKDQTEDFIQLLDPQSLPNGRGTVCPKGYSCFRASGDVHIEDLIQLLDPQRYYRGRGGYN